MYHLPKLGKVISSSSISLITRLKVSAVSTAMSLFSIISKALSTSKYEARKEEVLAKWATGYRGKLPLDWKRDKNLIRRGRPNKPRPNTARNVINTTRVIGAKKVLKDFRTLTKTLQGLIRKYGNGNTKQLQKAYKAVRIKTSAKG